MNILRTLLNLFYFVGTKSADPFTKRAQKYSNLRIHLLRFSFRSHIILIRINMIFDSVSSHSNYSFFHLAYVLNSLVSDWCSFRVFGFAFHFSKCSMQRGEFQSSVLLHNIIIVVYRQQNVRIHRDY